MELLKLSKYKLQLGAVIAELEQLKERERSGTQQIHHLNQKLKQSEEDFSRKLQELQAELASSHDLRCKIENKVKYLENDNFLLENKQKELKATIDSLLQSRETFVNLYEDSTCELRRSIETRDRKIAFLSEKIKNHFVLFDSIEKEAISVKQVVDNVQQIVSDKECLVAELSGKMDKISAYEKDFFDKIHFLENKLRYTEEELRKKDTQISGLQGQLEAAKISNDCRPKIEELQKLLSVKNEVIQHITEEKKALRGEVRGLEISLQKMQDAVMSMDAEDQQMICAALEVRQECDEDHKCREECSPAATYQGAPQNRGSFSCQENLTKDANNEDHNMDSCISQDNCTLIVQHQLDSESSTTECRNLNVSSES